MRSKSLAVLCLMGLPGLSGCLGGGLNPAPSSGGGSGSSTHLVTPSTDAQSTASPNVAQSVARGSTQSFTVTANSGYLVAKSVGGTCPAGSWSGSVYTTGAVTSDCTVAFTSTANCTSCRVFPSAAVHNGNLGGVSGADAICNSDANKPSGGGIYKALLVDGTNRVACTTANCSGGASEHMDWPLHASTLYKRFDDDATIMTTDSNGIFVFGSLTNTLIDIYGFYYWSGLNTDWTTSTANCSGWTSSSSSDYGSNGGLNATDSAAISSTFDQCNNPYGSEFLLCVEQ